MGPSNRHGLRRSQLLYGGFWGGLAVVAGVLLTYAMGPPDVDFQPRWIAAVWYFLGANWIPVEYERIISDLVVPTKGNIIEVSGQMHGLYAVPPVLMTFAAVLTGMSLSAATRPLDVVMNCLGAILGYVGATLVVLFATGGQPHMPDLLVTALVGGAVLLGARLVDRLESHDAVIATFAGVFTTVIVIGFIVGTVVPLVALTFGGTIVGAVLLIVASSLPPASTPERHDIR